MIPSNNIKNNLRRLLSEFHLEHIKNTPYRDGELVLEYVEGFEYPRYHIYYETGDLDSGDTDSGVIVELDSRFFDSQMATTIMEYLKTRE